MAAKRRRSDGAGRKTLTSPGRPPVASREDLVCFWASIAAGLSSEDAAAEVGVSMPVGSRWFRRSGGMPATHLSVSAGPLPPASGRYLSFAEREEIALLRVQGYGVRHISKAVDRASSTISRELRRAAATRGGNARRQREAATWNIVPRPHSGTLTDPRGGQRRPSWQRTRRCAVMGMIALPAALRGQTE